MNPPHYYSAIMPLLLPVVILISFIGPGRPVAALASYLPAGDDLPCPRYAGAGLLPLNSEEPS